MGWHLGRPLRSPIYEVCVTGRIKVLANRYCVIRVRDRKNLKSYFISNLVVDLMKVGRVLKLQLLSMSNDTSLKESKIRYRVRFYEGKSEQPW